MTASNDLVTAAKSVLRLRDEILPDDDPNMWRAPLFGAIDSMRAYLVEPTPTPDTPELAEESSRALADQCGISYRQLADWLDKGLISPRHVGVGSGNTRVLTPSEIARVRYLASLTHEYENVFGKQGRPLDVRPYSELRDGLAGRKGTEQI